ncbi:hypothetical protein Tco_1049462 [Tanacetum coccineum]
MVSRKGFMKWVARVLKRKIDQKYQRNIKFGFRIMKTQAIDDQDHLVNNDNDNENDDLGYRSEEYFNEGDEEDENNHSNRNVVKRGITRLYKFRREYLKPDGIKLSVTFDALNRISGIHRALFLSFLGDMVCEHIG